LRLQRKLSPVLPEFRPIRVIFCVSNGNFRQCPASAASTAYMHCMLYYWVLCPITGYGVPTTSVPCSFLLPSCSCF
jgi:hypothetical protein